MLPSIFGENLFDDFFTDPFSMIPSGRDVLYGKHGKNLMKTDVRETDNSYELDVDLPGFKKDEINVEIADGYLTIQASKGLDKDQQDKDGKYIRQERYAGSCSRSFYIGEDALIKPQFEAGREQVGKKGVVKDIKVHYEVIKKILDFARSIDLHVAGLSFSPIKGPEGNIEYLAYLKKAECEDNITDEKIQEIVDKSHNLL